MPIETGRPPPVLRRRHRFRGTEGSNPCPSTSESIANLTGLDWTQKYLAIVEEEKLLENVARVGQYLGQQLHLLVDKYAAAQAVRGRLVQSSSAFERGGEEALRKIFGVLIIFSVFMTDEAIDRFPIQGEDAVQRLGWQSAGCGLQESELGGREAPIRTANRGIGIPRHPRDYRATLTRFVSLLLDPLRMGRSGIYYCLAAVWRASAIFTRCDAVQIRSVLLLHLLEI